SAASVDVGELAAELVELFEPVAGDKGLALDCRHDAPAVVQGNRQLLAQLLTNLIENGLKYVPAGGRIEVAVRRLSHSVRLTVSEGCFTGVAEGAAGGSAATAAPPATRHEAVSAVRIFMREPFRCTTGR